MHAIVHAEIRKHAVPLCVMGLLVTFQPKIGRE
jgi:hypothetical protein